MEVTERNRRDRNVFRDSVDMAVDFGGLARKTLTAPGGNVGIEFGPDKTGRNEAAGCTNARVGQIMDLMEKGKTIDRGNKRTKNAS